MHRTQWTESPSASPQLASPAGLTSSAGFFSAREQNVYAEPVRDRPEIQMAIDLLQSRIDGLERRIGILAERLDPVLRPAAPSVPTQKGTKPGGVSPLASILDDLASRVGSIDECVTERLIGDLAL